MIITVSTVKIVESLISLVFHSLLFIPYNFIQILRVFILKYAYKWKAS